MKPNQKSGKFKIFSATGSWWLESPDGKQYEFGGFDTALMGFQGFDAAHFVPTNDSSTSEKRTDSLKRHGR